MFKWLFKRDIDEGIQDHLKKLNFHLANSFMNVKKDMDSMSTEVTVNGERFTQIDQRLRFLESQILTLFSQKQNPQEKTEELPSPGLLSLDPEMVLSELTYTQKSLLFAIYDHQKALNTPLSTKSIAKIFYSGRSYASVRTTITEYLDILASHGLIKKVKKRRQSYSHVTEQGINLIEKSVGKKKKNKRTADAY
ncbi:MAG: hypothetical protein CMH63_00180 [Nanoarchaeota archaeon]|jgi:predicted transcriptional regulator|nr:hypothetical protein [Nanoarchaeota archaeon]|tara:strand:+ start:40111 stop:40692 length:582 start_codon:yes stop_codon:yes gene_type:complete